jgi:hypothetical protein
MAKKKIKDVELDEELKLEDELEEDKKKKKVKKVQKETKKEEIVKPKRRKSKYERRKIIFKIAGWIMAFIMLVGSLAGIFGMLVYYNR